MYSAQARKKFNYSLGSLEKKEKLGKREGIFVQLRTEPHSTLLKDKYHSQIHFLISVLYLEYIVPPFKVSENGPKRSHIFLG